MADPVADLETDRANPREDGWNSQFLRVMPGEWNPKFATRRLLDYSIENKPHIEARAELFRAEHNVETRADTRADIRAETQIRADPGEEESIVRRFMCGPDESEICLPQADKVEEFCFGASLESLQVETGPGNKTPIALLDERSFSAETERSRASKGPLTSRGLYNELKKPRFRCDESNYPISNAEGSESSIATVRDSPNNDLNESEDKEPDAERRLIFITDLDRWSIFALIGTASYYQAFALRDALYKHLAFENFIGVTFSTEGLDMFQLAFHLPYYVWRSSQKAREDHRLDADANPLRQSQDVSFLNWRSPGPGFLYEAQISCVVAGSDEWRWVGYCFVDTYFDVVDEGKETVAQYHEDSLGEGGMSVDPFTFGKTNAANPIQKPKEYFLLVFRIRIGQVKREWQQVVAKVQQSIREYVQNHCYLLSLSGQGSSSKGAKYQDKMVRRSYDWIMKARRLSRQLSQDLSKTVDTYERFRLKHAVYFCNLSKSANGHRSLPAIQTTFDELESLNKILESLAQRCDDFAGDLKLHLILENNRVGVRQFQIAEYGNGLSMVMMLCVTPIALSAGILSMNKDVLPFITPNFVSFIVLVTTFVAVGLVIHVLQAHQTRLWEAVSACAGQRRWDRRIRGLDSDDVMIL